MVGDIEPARLSIRPRTSARRPRHSAALRLLTAIVIVWALIVIGAARGQSSGGPQWDQQHGQPNDQKTATLAPTPEEQYLLMKLQIERDLEDDILKWAQTRFWILAAVSLLLGFFGVRSLVREMLSAELKDAMKASAEANAAAAQGKEAVKDVRAEAAKYSANLEELTAAAARVDQKFSELRSRIDAEGTRSVAAADLKASAIETQLAELRTMVEVLARESQGTRRALAEFEQRRVQAERFAASNQADFAENSAFEVNVVGHGPGSPTEQLAHRLVAALAKLGFKASTGQWAAGHRVSPDIRVAYHERATKQAELVRNVITDAIADGWLESKPIDMDPKPIPVSGSKFDIVVFF